MKRMRALLPLNGRFLGCRATTVVFALLVVAVVAVPLEAVPGGGLQSEEAAALIEKGKALVADGKHEEAVVEFDKAVEVDKTFWEGWYQRGRALALLRRYEAATESLLQSTLLNPGHANAHMLTAHAAMYAEDLELAWDQGIRAYLAGEDPQAIFGGLGERSELPGDFDERVAAWRVYVAGVDTADLIAGAQRPDSGRGRASGVQEELIQIQPDLVRLQRHLSNALSDARGFGLVQTVEMAQYYVTISPDEIDAAPRPSMDGVLRLYTVESGDQVYSRSVSFRDLSASGQVQATLQNVINHMESWRRDEMQKQ